MTFERGQPAQDALVAVRPDASIQEIVAQVKQSGGRQVEVLVPNNTKALQSLAGCEILQRSAAGAGINIILFTADEQVISAATAVGLDVITVGSSIAPAWEPGAVGRRGYPLGVAVSSESVLTPATDHRPPTNQHSALSTQHSALRTPDRPEGTRTVPTPEGAVLFDASGDHGVPRPRSTEEVALEVESAKRKAQGEEPVLRSPLHPPRLLWLLTLVTAPLALAAAWFGVGALVGPGAAELALTPAAPLSEAQTFTGLEIPISTDQIPGAVQGVPLERQVGVLVQGEAISTTTVPIGRATGVLTLRNRSSFPVTLRAGQTLQAANGVTFVIDSGVTVPAAVERPDGSGTTYGQGSVTLTATVPGAVGNIPAGSISSIPGVEVALRVEHAAFTGGSDQQVQVVRTEDVNRVLPLAVSRLWAAGNQALQLEAANRSGLTLVDATVTPALEDLEQLQGVDYAILPGIGSVTTDGAFELELRTTFRGIAGPSDRPLEQQLTELIHDRLVAEGKVAEDTQIQIARWEFGGGEHLIVDALGQPSGEPVGLAPAFLQEVQTRIAGIPRDEAIAYLESLVADRKIGAFSPLPADWETVPERLVVKPVAQ